MANIQAGQQYPRQAKILMAVFVFIGMAGGAVGVLAGHSGSGSPWSSVVFVEIIFLSIVALTLLLIRWSARRNGTTIWFSSPVYALDRTDQKIVGKSVGWGRAVTEPRLAPIAIEVAERTLKQPKWIMVVWLMLLANQIYEFFNADTAAGMWFCGSLTVVFVFVIGMWSWARRNARQSKLMNQALLDGLAQ
jgi:hypothetical protein